MKTETEEEYNSADSRARRNGYKDYKDFVETEGIL
jgi:hypothetical protein